jgi:hypothetical protein
MWAKWHWPEELRWELELCVSTDWGCLDRRAWLITQCKIITLCIHNRGSKRLGLFFIFQDVAGLCPPKDEKYVFVPWRDAWRDRCFGLPGLKGQFAFHHVIYQELRLIH